MPKQIASEDIKQAQELCKEGKSMRGKHITSEDIKRVQELYKEGKSVRGISIMTGWSQHSVEKMIWANEDKLDIIEPKVKLSAHAIQTRKRINEIMQQRNGIRKAKRRERIATRIIPNEQIPKGYIW